jgi:hypothetical protein
MEFVWEEVVVNLSPSGFIGCSMTFAIHLIASMVSRRPITSLLATSLLGGVLAASVNFATPPPPPPASAPSVPGMAYVKTVK